MIRTDRARLWCRFSGASGCTSRPRGRARNRQDRHGPHDRCLATPGPEGQMCERNRGGTAVTSGPVHRIGNPSRIPGGSGDKTGPEVPPGEDDISVRPLSRCWSLTIRFRQSSVGSDSPHSLTSLPPLSPRSEGEGFFGSPYAGRAGASRPPTATSRRTFSPPSGERWPHSVFRVRSQRRIRSGVVNRKLYRSPEKQHPL